MNTDITVDGDIDTSDQLAQESKRVKTIHHQFQNSIKL